MMKNLLEIDTAAKRVSICSKNGCIVLFDFTAAFPSLAHDMIWDVLTAIGIDESFINVIRAFYCNNRHVIKVKGQRFNGVTVHSGVRQGCPLSGLLFAICIDVLIERLTNCTGKRGCVAAFADDIGIVVENLWTTAPHLAAIFQEFTQISALSLNLNKTAAIPLWSMADPHHIQRLMKELCPLWASISISNKGKYLGFVIGPGAGDDSWKKPLAKFESRVLQWAAKKLGLAMNVIAFNIYIAPVLEYVAQLEEVSTRVLNSTLWALRRLASGPGSWATQRDLENLTAFGLKFNFRTIRISAVAAKLRIYKCFEHEVIEMRESLQIVRLSESTRLDQLVDETFVDRLIKNREEVERAGICLYTIGRQLSLSGCSHSDRQQKLLRDAVKMKLEPYNAARRVQAKIARWKFDGAPEEIAATVLQNYERIGSQCRPCVVASCFRTLWNGWPTSARMRSMQNHSGTEPCIFGCADAEDRIEHYMTCGSMWQVLSTLPPSGLGMQVKRRKVQTMMMATPGMADEEVLAAAVA
eukprot:12423019-Karenia_brevis.AAC.1